jgi:hypothetical protein
MTDLETPAALAQRIKVAIVSMEAAAAGEQRLLYPEAVGSTPMALEGLISIGRSVINLHTCL